MNHYLPPIHPTPHGATMSPTMNHYLPPIHPTPQPFQAQKRQPLPPAHNAVRKVVRAHNETPPPMDCASPFLPGRRTLTSRENMVLFPPGPNVWYKKANHVRRLPPIPMFGVVSSHVEMFDPELVSPTAMSLKPLSARRFSAEVVPPNLVQLQRCFMLHSGPDGLLGWKDFVSCLKDLGVKHEGLSEIIWKIFDSNFDGVVCSTEILKALQEMFIPPDRDRVFKACFKVYDVDGSGKLCMSELMTVAQGAKTSEQHGVTEAQRATLLHLFKHSKYINDDGILEFPEFCELMMNEPSLVKAMFSTVATQLARKHGFSFEPPEKKPRTPNPRPGSKSLS